MVAGFAQMVTGLAHMVAGLAHMVASLARVCAPLARMRACKCYVRCPRVLYSRSLGAASAQMVVRLAQVVVRLAHRNDLFRDIPDASENEMTFRKQPVLLPFHALRALISIFSKLSDYYYRRNSDKISSKSEQKSPNRIKKKNEILRNFAKKCEKD